MFHRQSEGIKRSEKGDGSHKDKDINLEYEKSRNEFKVLQEYKVSLKIPKVANKNKFKSEK